MSMHRISINEIVKCLNSWELQSDSEHHMQINVSKPGNLLWQKITNLLKVKKHNVLSVYENIFKNLYCKTPGQTWDQSLKISDETVCDQANARPLLNLNIYRDNNPGDIVLFNFNLSHESCEWT